MNMPSKYHIIRCTSYDLYEVLYMHVKIIFKYKSTRVFYEIK